MKRLFIIALVVILLPTLFCCNKELSNDSVNFIESNINIREIKGTFLDSGITITVVITDYDTITIFSKYYCGSVIIDRRPTKVGY